MPKKELMGMSVVVDQHNFQAEVVEKSYECPVLIDFFATWCGPCQMLKPVLEKLAQEYDFVLAKVDIDRNPDLANTYGIEGVPDVRVATQGQVIDGFVGMLPEPQLREFLARLNLKSQLEIGLEAIQVARAAGDMAEAGRLFQSLVTQYPANRPLKLDAAHFWLTQNQLDAAGAAIADISDQEREFGAPAQAIREMIQFKQAIAAPASGSELDVIYLKAVQDALDGHHEAALTGFLELVGRDRKYRNDGARKAMITLFNVLGDDHPLTRDYRKRLMQTLY